MLARRFFSSSSRFAHENPLGLPRNTPQAPQIPRRTGPIAPRKIPNVKHVVLVSSCKGGVGKSTIAVNLAVSLALSRLHVGILDLDIFGPSIPTLMGLRSASEPELTSGGALRPITNHSIPTMSMAYLLPPMPPNPTDPGSQINTSSDTPVVWRGLMVQKAVQQLLFQVDWTGGEGGPGLDVLVIDLPPGTGDIPLSLGQLVIVDGTLIVSTPQDVALTDVRRGISMFRKLNLPLTGLILNQSYFLCPSCTTPHHLFGAPDLFRRTAKSLDIPILAELPLVPGVSEGGDGGAPYALTSKAKEGGRGGEEWRSGMKDAAQRVLDSIKQQTK
ncbi:hypothetical protein D9758_005767 [Tetrapyrgos nigripes]|uniref:P-loop containing nucleoside triphosphate hydrolase protein n=1 Tax=Tetrapyrgos nigripes TaxID=182062 RepID=A0A8H5GJV3_9AGAR|nr:hypothetical protein D9758_005767 [Tetrapyrgos nigripes]